MTLAFSQQAQHALYFAQEAARHLGSDRVDAEHLLLGLVHHEETVVAAILNTIGISGARIRSAVERLINRGPGEEVDHLDLTFRAQRVLNLAEEEAQEHGSPRIGGEHLLIGLLRIDEGVSGRVLSNLGITLERVRAETAHLAEHPLPEDRSVHGLLHQLGKQLLALHPELVEIPAEELKGMLFPEPTES